ncbi:MAG: lysophospholipid acyltransferase family protein [Victivallaceae bacterium]|nr:lysophospholipid acyltransferase family protein [Victivallaceae bacterium]
MGITFRTYFTAVAASFLYTLCALPFLILLLFLKKNSRRKLWRKFIVCYGRWILFWTLKIRGRIEYTDMRPEENSPGIFIANHRSASDAFLMAVLNQDLVQVVSAWPSKLPFWGFFARRGGYLNIDRLPFEEFMKSACRELAHGVSIVSFPEGTRSGSKEMKQFHGGIFRVALAAQCPLYPLCITGNENMPDRNFRMHDGKIRIFKLPRINYDQYKNMSAFALKKYVRNMLQEKMDREERE